MKVSDLKEGMLIAPPEDSGWWPYVSANSDFPMVRVNWKKNCSETKTTPAIYLGKIKFEQTLYGLYTWHKILYNGLLYLIDGYEFHRGKIEEVEKN